jgi:hypothetical protein
MRQTVLTLSLLAALPLAQAQSAQRQFAVQFDLAPLEQMAQELLPVALPVALQIGDEALAFAGRELDAERVVKGAPYCATAVHETVQLLMDGNRIVRKQSTQLCRDGEGRTRREVQREGRPALVYLNDPVARERWVLDPERKTARKLGRDLAFEWQGLRGDAPSGLAERMREQAERWRDWAAQVAERARDGARGAERAAAGAASAAGKAEKAEKAARQAEAARSGKQAGTAPSVPTLEGEPGVVIETEILTRQPGASEPERRREVRVLRMGDLPQGAPMPPMPPVPPMPPFPPMPFVAEAGPMLPREGGVSSALPAREIEGLKVNGERTTWTIEAGKIGNEKPIVISREVWRSPELMLTVLSKDSDPRRGEVSYRLERVNRGEPDAALMKLPGDYQQPQRAPRTPAPPNAAPKAPGA